MATTYKRILFPTDLSDDSFAAWPHALHLAQGLGAEIHAVTVIEEPYALAPFDQYGALLQALRDVKPQIEQRLSDRVKEHPAEVNVKTFVLEGPTPASTIVEYARREACDLVVLATHGRGGLSHLLLGSVAERVVRTAPVPVLTVRPDKK